MNNVKGKVGSAVSAAQEDDEAHRRGGGAFNARAEFEASLSPEQRAAAHASRKAELTDEASGDNPKEATPRMEKQTLQESLDTPH